MEIWISSLDFRRRHGLVRRRSCTADVLTLFFSCRPPNWAYTSYTTRFSVARLLVRWPTPSPPFHAQPAPEKHQKPSNNTQPPVRIGPRRCDVVGYPSQPQTQGRGASSSALSITLPLCAGYCLSVGSYTKRSSAPLSRLFSSSSSCSSSRAPCLLQSFIFNINSDPSWPPSSPASTNSTATHHLKQHI